MHLISLKFEYNKFIFASWSGISLWSCYLYSIINHVRALYVNNCLERNVTHQNKMAPRSSIIKSRLIVVRRRLRFSDQIKTLLLWVNIVPLYVSPIPVLFILCQLIHAHRSRHFCVLLGRKTPTIKPFTLIKVLVVGISECSSDVETSSDIPIAVGSALGGLIVIVLVAYAIGRRCKEKGDYDTI